MSLTNKLVEFVQQGGYAFMIPLIMMSILSLSVILERIIALRKKKIIPADFLKKVKDYSETAEKNISSKSLSLTELILNKAIVDYEDDGNNNSLEKYLEINAELHMEYLVRRLWILNAIGNLAPLLGLLGTVVGLSIAFKQIGIEGLSQESVASGISMALITTITGLSIAIPTLFALYGIRAKGERFLKEIKNLLNKFLLINK